MLVAFRGAVEMVGTRGRQGSLIATTALVGAGIGAGVAPLHSLSIALLFAAMYFAVTHPGAFVLTCVGLSVAFPKAGVKVDGFPFPVFIFVLFAIAILMRMRSRVVLPRSQVLPLVTLITTGYMLWRAIVAFNSGGAGFAAALLAWSLGPIALLLLVAHLGDVPTSFLRAAQIGFLATVCYALLQLSLGIDRVAVHGLTYAWGDDLAAKNNHIGNFGGTEVSKIFSTYQNGNLYGITAAVFLLLSIHRLLARERMLPELLVGAAAMTAIILSGSRTALLATLAGTCWVLLTSGRLSRMAAVIALFGSVGALIILNHDALLVRYSVDSILDSGGSGRLLQWEHVWRKLTPGQFLVGSTGIPEAEGWAGIVTQVGVVGMFLVVISVVLAVPRSHRPRGVAIALFVAALIDTSYYFFPTWYLPALMTSAIWSREPDILGKLTPMAPEHPKTLQLRRPRRYT